MPIWPLNTSMATVVPGSTLVVTPIRKRPTLSSPAIGRTGALPTPPASLTNSTSGARTASSASRSAFRQAARKRSTTSPWVARSAR